MKPIMILFLSVASVMILITGCDKSSSPQQKIKGTWVGTQYPDSETIKFTNRKAKMEVASGGWTGTWRYEISDQEIILTGAHGYSNHEYQFINDDLIYITRLRIQLGMQDGGIEFRRM